jgi:phospholipase C
MRPGLVAVVVSLLVLAGCGGSGIAPNAGVVRPAPLRAGLHHGIHRIRHVVVIMQENRSFDSYFGTFPGADGIPTKDGQFSVCLPDPRSAGCQYPYHDASQVNGGAQHNADSSQADTDGGRMDGFVATAERPGGRACGGLAPICASSAPPDVMGYHDAREIRTTGAGRTTSRSRTTCSSRAPRGASPHTCSWCRAGPRTARAAAIPPAA